MPTRGHVDLRILGAGGLLVREPPHEGRVRSPSVEVVEYLGNGGPHYPASIGRQPMIRSQAEPGCLQPVQIGIRAVDGDLLVMAGPDRFACRVGRRRRLRRFALSSSGFRGCRHGHFRRFGRRQRRLLPADIVPGAAIGHAAEQQVGTGQAGSTRHGPLPPSQGPGTPGPRWKRVHRSGSARRRPTPPRT